MNRILIKGGRAVTEEGLVNSDVLIEGEKIAGIGPAREDVPGTLLIDATGKIVMPGIVDPHVHFELSAYNSLSADDFYSGSCAAAASGITAFIDFAIPAREQKLKDRILEKNESASAQSVIDYSFHAQIVGWGSERAAQMKDAMDMGVTSFKVFMPATEGWGIGDAGLYEALKISGEIKGLVMVHAENGELTGHFTRMMEEAGRTSIKDYPGSRPAFTEKEAVSRAGIFAAEAGAPLYVCHVSSAGAVSELSRLKREGSDIFVETCPQYLLLTEDFLKGPRGYLFMCCPPLRKERDRCELWRGIMEETVDAVGSDHCPFAADRKRSGGENFIKTPMGLPAMENSFSLIFTEGVLKRHIDLMQIYRIMSLNPAKIFGLYPRKGTLKEGSDADIVVFDPDSRKKIRTRDLYSACDWSPYENTRISAGILWTISRGEVVYDGSRVLAAKGRGRFLQREPSYYYQ